MLFRQFLSSGAWTRIHGFRIRRHGSKYDERQRLILAYHIIFFLCKLHKYGMSKDACQLLRSYLIMMTSSNGKIFRVTGPLRGDFCSPWIPHTKALTRSFGVFFICVWINGWVNNLEAGDFRRHRGHNDVIVMWIDDSVHMIKLSILSHSLAILFHSMHVWTGQNLKESITNSVNEYQSSCQDLLELVKCETLQCPVWRPSPLKCLNALMLKTASSSHVHLF